MLIAIPHTHTSLAVKVLSVSCQSEREETRLRFAVTQKDSNTHTHTLLTQMSWVGRACFISSGLVHRQDSKLGQWTEIYACECGWELKVINVCGGLQLVDVFLLKESIIIK